MVQIPARVRFPWCPGPRASPPRLSRALIKQHTQDAQLGFLGSSYINVLQLNEALAKLH